MIMIPRKEAIIGWPTDVVFRTPCRESTSPGRKEAVCHISEPSAKYAGLRPHSLTNNLFNMQLAKLIRRPQAPNIGWYQTSPVNTSQSQ